MKSIRRLLVFVGIVGSFCLGWLAHTGPDVVTAQSRKPIMMTRIYTGPDGLSHAEEIEMKLNPAATIHTVRLDPVDIISYQKSREFSHSRLVTQQIDLGRTLLGKFHKNTIITEVDIEVELIEADFGGDLASRQIQRP